MKNNYNILIIEDELLIAEMLKEILLELHYNVVGMAKNYQEAQLHLHEGSIDLAILDINLNDTKNGIDIGSEIKEKHHFPFIYLTSYSDPTTIQNATQTLPSSYLLKPFTKEDLFTTIELVKARNKNTNSTIIIKDGHNNIKLQSKNIISVQSDGNYIEINTGEKKHVIRNSIEKFLEEINNTNFVRIHRSYVINITKVEAVNGQYLFINKNKYPLSRKYREQVLQKFHN